MIPNSAKAPSVTAQEIDSLLSKIVLSRDLHFKWLNTLSLLEHIGSRKIHHTQTGYSVTEMVLRHAAEEARHAAFFKKLALKIDPDGPKDFPKDSLLAGFSAISYFQKLDSCVDRSLTDEDFRGKTRTFLCYLYVTKMIEERAGLVYEIYDRILEENKIGISIGGIIKEEENHLFEMNSCLSQLDPKFQERSEFFRQKEDALFKKYYQNIKHRVGVA
ncbi:hypothetical protein EHQ27_10790 [Leptospira wolffii]|uniref:Rubrerythrin n=1 Tax=Leptospira wolffii TaxID=409998 RepID=A0A2M9ZA40_9LEPT|nr:hypothetical protein [Leptospira wolffii]EPG67221.1 hypothetical protein LEP1GSC061_2074 [Leptospira wolffii serovar Khorat str. Khorat-H2]PJZ65217.1 hypothetical protein CH371_14990 [Leptospira wolffii]TGK56654.1 hypothetical protein EHQ32_13740 [Leptospira wolffii]TGK71764.1 hypothetical protein EHQ27_10790 [Leptospira wolffii]TGK75379.1 hypothetical protein EHQ35_03115 [Leptospira wolffii]